MRTKRRVLLINPPSPPGATANREGAGGLGVLYPTQGAFFYPAHTLASIASVLRNQGYGSMVMDMVAWQGTAPLAAKVIERGSWHAAIILVSQVTLEHDLDFVRFLRQGAACPPIVVVGPAARSLESAPGVPADFVVIGEPENVLMEADGTIFCTVPGGSPVFLGKGGAGWVEDLDSLPYPSWDLVPTGKGGFLTLYGSKGCDRGCVYCPYVVAQGRRVRTRSVESVVQEIEWLAKTLLVQRLVFRDVAFAKEPARVGALCRALIDKKLAVRWECESHPLDFQPELLKLMKKAGCTEIKVGLETTHPGLLQEWGRVACAEEAEQYLARVAALVQICRELEVRCHLFLMVGVPGQTKETLRATHDYLAKVCPPSINVKFFHPYGGIALPGAAAQGLGAQEAVDFSRRLQDCQTPLDHKRRRFHFPPFGIPSRRGSRVGPSP